jgi:hypothetical protein
MLSAVASSSASSTKRRRCSDAHTLLRTKPSSGDAGTAIASSSTRLSAEGLPASLATDEIGPESQTFDQREFPAFSVLCHRTEPPTSCSVASSGGCEAELRCLLHQRKRFSKPTFWTTQSDHRLKPTAVRGLACCDRVGCVLIASFLQAVHLDDIDPVQSPPHLSSSPHHRSSPYCLSLTSVAATGAPIGCELIYDTEITPRLFGDTTILRSPAETRERTPPLSPTPSDHLATAVSASVAGKGQASTIYAAFATLCAASPNPFAASNAEWPTTTPSVAYDYSKNYSFVRISAEMDNLVESNSCSSLCQLSSQDSGVFFTA